MVEFKQHHKMDIQKLSTAELYQLRQELIQSAHDQVAIIDAELDRWEPVACRVCGEEDLAYRGEPFITWGKVDGYILCPRHLHKITHADTIYKRKRQIEEIFA